MRPESSAWSCSAEVAVSLARELVPVRTTAVVTDDWIAWPVDGLRARAGLGIMYDSEPSVL